MTDLMMHKIVSNLSGPELSCTWKSQVVETTYHVPEKYVCDLKLTRSCSSTSAGKFVSVVLNQFNQKLFPALITDMLTGVSTESSGTFGNIFLVVRA